MRCLLPTGKVLCLLAAIVVAGGHWGVLQGVAWAGMIGDYTRDYGWVLGVVRTLDGSQPCTLCDKVRQGVEQDDRQQLPAWKTEKKTEAFSPLETAWPVRNAGVAFSWLRTEAVAPRGWSAPPDLPPPRA